MKYIISLIVLIVIALGYFLKSPSVIVDSQPQAQGQVPQNAPTASIEKLSTHSHDHDHQHDHTGEQNIQDDSEATGPTGNPHFDQLTPQMQQAVKDSLLLEGPMETYTRPDGAIVMPSKGRFTQMPVAVEMPDGSIQIREYSVTPKPRNPSAQ